MRITSRSTALLSIVTAIVALVLATFALVSQRPTSRRMALPAPGVATTTTTPATIVLDPTCTQLTATAYTVSCAFSVSEVGGGLTGGVLSFATTFTPNDQGAALSTPATPGCTLDVTGTDQSSTCQVTYPDSGTYYTETQYDGGPGAYSASTVEPVSVSAPAPIATATSVALSGTTTYAGEFAGGAWGDYETCYSITATSATTDTGGHVVATPSVSIGFDTTSYAFHVPSGTALTYCVEYFADVARGQTTPTGPVTIALSPPHQMMRQGQYVVGGIAMPTELTATASYAGTATDAASQGTATTSIADI